MSLKNLISKNSFFILSLFIFSILINHHYANLGAFPIDTFLHFDIGYRLLQGEIPFSDVWMVSGVLVDYMQALFFYLFGANWYSYVFHASLINGLVSVSTYLLLRSFKININYCFIYSILFSVLAYTSSGTPFVDHHATFFSLMGIYFLLLGIKTEKKIYWFLLPVILGFGFLSKQVPSVYVILSISIVVIIYSIILKKIELIKYILLGSFVFLTFVLIFGFLAGIKFENFIVQYILYPVTVGETRFDGLGLAFIQTIGHFKFIYLSILPIFFINIKKIISENKYFYNKDFFYFLTILFFTFSLIFHQLLSKNQTFIFFLIPLLIAFSHRTIDDLKITKKKLVSIFLIFCCLSITFKYHLRFNEGRKFHELSSVDLSKSIPAEQIHKKLKGLNWISPNYKNDVQREIQLINKIKKQLKSDKREKMVITNYSFFSLILNEKLSSPSMAYTDDGTTYPLGKSKYSEAYKTLIIENIKKNNIKIIYIIDPVDKKSIYDYLSKDCFEEDEIFKELNSYVINKCNDL